MRREFAALPLAGALSLAGCSSPGCGQPLGTDATAIGIEDDSVSVVNRPEREQLSGVDDA